MRYACLLSCAALLGACHSHITSGGKDSSVLDDLSPLLDFSSLDFHDAAYVPGNNVVPITVDGGPSGNVTDVGYISVTLCAPGDASNCQTLDHISIDTGSIGLRLIGASLNPSLLNALPNTMVAGGALSECYAYADGYVYGSVRTADFTIGGEVSASMPFHVLGDLATTPADCAMLGNPESNIGAFGANGIIGIGLFTPDCGDACTGGTAGNPIYYACSAGNCTLSGVDLSLQVPNPIATFGNDNNGVIIQLPSVDDNSGAVNPSGMLIFGVGTQQNNSIGGETIYAASDSGGLATVTGNVNGVSFPVTIFDSGTSTLAVTLNGIPECDESEAPGFLCPTSTQALTAMITDANDANSMVNFSIANALSLFGNQGATAFDDMGGVGVSNFLIFGLPFFYGRRMYFAINNAPTPNGNGPFYAF
jgi:Protein of unknown function (DUF3443)